MHKDFLPFSKPCINQAAIDEVVACIKSGWLTTGPRVKAFENALVNYLSAANVLAVNSATSGLHLALESLGIGSGDEVITTPFTFVATLNTIVHTGAKPVLVDACLDTYNIDVQQIEDAITDKTKAIMPVHFAGVPVDLDPIYAIAKKHNLRVIEDAAQAIGSKYKGKLIGSFGDTQVFSFHANKTITTGEGGCIAACDQELVKKANVLRFHGIDREAWNRNAKEGSQYYDVIGAGFKYNMMDIQAAMGLHQLAELELFIQKRELLAKRYNEAFAKWDAINMPKMPAYDIRHSWYIYTPLLNPEAAGISHDDFIQAMKEKDIGVGYHYRAAHLFSYYRDKFGYKQGQFPNAEFISERIMTLPLFPDMTLADQDRVIEAMAEILKEKKP
jgi:dTDP-4-amino-4,6-dideoxygalactose transaminase